MPVVMLKKDWPGNFRRNVREGKTVLRTLEFSPGVNTEVEDCDMPAIKSDIEKGALVVSQHLKLAKAVQEPEPAAEVPPVEEPKHNHGRHRR